MLPTAGPVIGHQLALPIEMLPIACLSVPTVPHAALATVGLDANTTAITSTMAIADSPAVHCSTIVSVTVSTTCSITDARLVVIPSAVGYHFAISLIDATVGTNPHSTAITLAAAAVLRAASCLPVVRSRGSSSTIMMVRHACAGLAIGHASGVHRGW